MESSWALDYKNEPKIILKLKAWCMLPKFVIKIENDVIFEL
jgi:hypothetical protein